MAVITTDNGMSPPDIFISNLIWSVNGPISLKQYFDQVDYMFYHLLWLDSFEIWFDHNSTYYCSVSKTDVRLCISHCHPKPPI